MTDFGDTARKMGRRTTGPAITYSGFGFDSLSDESCARLLVKYAQNIEDLTSGRVNWAGGTLRQNRKWHRELSTEVESRGL